MARIAKDQYYLDIADAVSKRSTCLRRHYGSVIVKDDIIVATGYNGSARGELNCVDAKKCVREELKVPHGERYELCMAVHSEMNAIIQAGYEKTKNATLYLSGTDIAEEGMDTKIKSPRPCKMCWRFIKNAGIIKVVCGVDDVLFTSEETEAY